jgi:hypothetical protein
MTNLHTLLLACAAAVLAAGHHSPSHPDPCPPEAGALVTAGWSAYRADSIDVAAERFARADRLCANHLDAKVGLGFSRIRQERFAEAESLFTLVATVDPANGDGWDGLTLARWRRGDRQGAREAGRRAIVINPANATTRSILAAIDPDWDREPIRPPARQRSLRVDARVRGDYFEVPAGTGWRQFYVNGVNMGVALPGRFPAEFPQDSSTYAGWIDTLSAMHANTLRLYTILPPAFYRALRGWNLTHHGRLLYLVHGVWTELPPSDNFDDLTWKEAFRAEMRSVVDVIHGNASIPVRPGHAGGRYDADISRWTLGYIIGREWEPFAVKEFDARHGTPRPYHGRFLAIADSVPSMDVWMAEQCDYMVSHEVDRWNTVRPIAYTNWPTLDPLTHPTESTAEEERLWRSKVGRPVVRDPVEYENDVIALDPSLVRPTDENPAGWFASYHAYPYYPDFILYDPGYGAVRSSEGPSNYFGYLSELKRHHAGIPLLISEYGVPSSRGVAHLQPQGWSHGGLDEVETARIDARLTREIRESGAAGGIVFAWIDEWFKKNWLVIDYEIPRQNTRQWHNVMDAEQNYGMLGMYAGAESTTPLPGGDPARWLALPPLMVAERPAAGAPSRLRVGQDESYLYLAVEFAGLPGGAFPWAEQDVLIALDTYRADLGQRSLPGRVLGSDVGFEFLALFRDTTDADLRVTPDYNPYQGPSVIRDGDDFGQFARRPVTTLPRRDGRFDSLYVITNRSRFTRNGQFIPAQGVNRGRLRFGSATRNSLADWYWEPSASLLQVRLPWNLLNVSDPSTRTVLFETQVEERVGTAPSDGFRIGVLVRATPASGQPVLQSALPTATSGQWTRRQFPTWQWPAWTTPQYHQRLKPVYDSLQSLWTAWETAR